METSINITPNDIIVMYNQFFVVRSSATKFQISGLSFNTLVIQLLTIIHKVILIARSIHFLYLITYFSISYFSPTSFHYIIIKTASSVTNINPNITAPNKRGARIRKTIGSDMVNILLITLALIQKQHKLANDSIKEKKIATLSFFELSSLFFLHLFTFPNQLLLIILSCIFFLGKVSRLQLLFALST